MISEEQLQQYEDMATDYRYDGSVFKPVVVTLIAEVRGLQKTLHAVSDTSNKLLEHNNQLEKESFWLADMLASIGRCAKRYHLDAECHDDKDCTECWQRVAANETV